MASLKSCFRKNLPSHEIRGTFLGGFLYEISPSYPFLTILPIFVTVFLIASNIRKDNLSDKTL